MILGLVAGILFLIFIRGPELEDSNMKIENLSWKNPESCSEHERVDFSLEIYGVDYQLLKAENKEIQCKLIIDGEDRFAENETYFCDIKDGLDSWFFVDPKHDHEVAVCCSIDDFKDEACRPMLIKKRCT